MTDLAIRRCTGVAALGTVIFSWLQFPLYTLVGAPSSIEGVPMVQHFAAIKTIAFTRILLDQALYVCMMVFAAGFRHLIRQARQDYEWIGTLLFGAAVVWLATTLVADGMAGGAVLDAISRQPDPSAVRALVEGTVLIYNSSTAFVMTGFFLAVAGYATFGTGILPAWTGWLAYAAAALCVLCLPAMYGGPVDPAGLYNAGSWLPALVANFPPLFWFAAIGVLLLRAGRLAPAGPRTAVMDEQP